MPGTSPVWALPYPLGTDPISDGDDQMKNLATRLDNMMRAGWASVNTNASGDASITFPTPFPSSLATAVLTDATEGGAGGMFLKWTRSTSDKTRITFRVYQQTGVVLPSFNVLVAYVAFGS